MRKRFEAQKRWATQMEGATKAVLQETSSWQEESLHKKELECKAAGVLQRGEARGRRAEEHRAADSAVGHGFREADHRASQKTGGDGHTVVRVPGVSSVSLGRLHLLVSTKRGKQCNWWCAACGGQHEWRNPNVIVCLCPDRDSGDLPLCVVVVGSTAAVSSKCLPINGRR